MSKSPFEFYKKQLPLILILLVLILSIRSSIIEPFRIPTRSMLPGLMKGDFLFANKLRYGLHLPFTEFLQSPVFLNTPKKPERGDVVIFTPPEAGQESLYIKRIVGLPGDRIRFEGKSVVINDRPLSKIELTGEERSRILSEKGFDPDSRYDHSKLHIYRESLTELMPEKSEKTYLTIEDDSFENTNATQEFVVPEDHYFVLGDNRDDTRDSRVFGVISGRSIRAKAMLVWFSSAFNFGRVGKLIQ